jgi:hypothetical protein
MNGAVTGLGFKGLTGFMGFTSSIILKCFAAIRLNSHYSKIPEIPSILYIPVIGGIIYQKNVELL